MAKPVDMAAPPASDAATGGTPVILAYAVTIFFSAFLLFQVQPLISKFILPWFGGSPAVWTAAMLFFQVALFGGYLYAHLTSTYLSARAQFFLHAALLLAATGLALATYISPGESFKPTGDENESPLWKILILLTATVGLPYFVLSSTGPLLQKWFSDAFEGASPYRLFALSNLGSLLALLSYPFFFEVRFDSQQQGMIWSWAFALFAACCAYCAWFTYQARSAHKNVPATTTPAKPAADDAPTSVWRWIAWLCLPALASVMFLAVTNEVTQNVATVPLLWIIPLSLYLVSFIVAFDHPRWYSRPVYAAAAVVLLVYMSNFRSISLRSEDLINNLFGLSEAYEINLHPNLTWRCIVFFSGLFLVCMICHCELAALKPAPRRLTAFFLTMSLGGALGGILVNLFAPYVFTTFFELPLGLLFSICIAAALLTLAFPTNRVTIPGVLSVLVAAVAVMLVCWQQYDPREGQEPNLLPGTLLLGCVTAGLLSLAFPAARTRVPGVASAVVGSAAALYVLYQVGDEVLYVPDPNSPFVYTGRSFYGLVSARHNNLDTPLKSYLTFKSGSVAHGRQWSHPDKQRDTNIAYWGPGSGCRRVLEYATNKYEKCRIGVVGLGIGTIAGFAKPGQYVRMYEINPQVIEIAEDHFYFVKNCRADGVECDLVLGDARLKLERELEEMGSHQFDVLCLDAFSGDAVPMHLLTTEAFETYKRHLKPNGIIVANVTNTFLDLYPVVRRLGEEHGFKHTRVYADPDKELCFFSYFVLLTNDEEFLQANPVEMTGAPPEFLSTREAPLWTDRYHSLWHVLQ